MSVAIAHRNFPAIISGITAMILLIVLVDALVWRTVLVWVQRFKLEETASQETQTSAVLEWLKRSRLIGMVIGKQVDSISEKLSRRKGPPIQQKKIHSARATSFFFGIFALTMAWAAWRLLHLLISLPFAEWSQVVA